MLVAKFFSNVGIGMDVDPKREEALNFLDELANRHDHVLDELEALNQRLETVLDVYAKSKNSASATSSESQHEG